VSSAVSKPYVWYNVPMNIFSKIVGGGATETQANCPQVTFCSGVGTVTGANFLFTFPNNLKMLIDCGLLQGEGGGGDFNRQPFPYVTGDISYLFVTHAHLDHVGRIPKLVKDGFKGIIYSTPETKALAELIMNDSAELLGHEAKSKGILPIYDHDDVPKALALWQTVPYHQPFPVKGGEAYDLRVVFNDAGHILGSTMYQFSWKVDGAVRTTVFTGDLGNSPAPLLRDTEPLKDVNYLIMESVYGDKNHEPADERREKLKRIINETYARGGTLVIPAFSLERTQVILFEIDDLLAKGDIPQVPVYVDSPLATHITEIYKNAALRDPELYNATARAAISKGDRFFDFPHLKYTEGTGDSLHLDRITTPKIIIASSGMSNGGRVTRHEVAYLPDPKSTVLLVGFQSLGTLGRKLQDGIGEVIIGDTRVEVKAHIENIFGYSSHKDSDHLVEFVATTTATLKQAFLVMGEPKASLFLAQKLHDNLGVNALYPERLEPYDLQ
jgi:metallo-beta-lactamase family protein